MITNATTVWLRFPFPLAPPDRTSSLERPLLPLSSRARAGHGRRCKSVVAIKRKHIVSSVQAYIRQGVRCIYWIIIIQARTKKNRHIGYTASIVRFSGRPVPLKKFIDAGQSALSRALINLPSRGPTQNGDSPHTLHPQHARLTGIRTNTLCTSSETIEASNMGARAYPKTHCWINFFPSFVVLNKGPNVRDFAETNCPCQFILQ